MPPSAASHQKVTVKAANLTASFEVQGSNMTAVFSWDASTALPHQRLTGYQVTWAEIIPTTRHTGIQLPHSLISQSQILPPVSIESRLTDQLNDKIQLKKKKCQYNAK